MPDYPKPSVLVSGFDSLEGPAFDRQGNLYFVNWLSSQILKTDWDGHVTEFYNTGGIPAGLAFHPDGSLYVADEGDDIHGVLRITPDGKGEILVNEFEGRPLNGANDLVFDRDGALYFSDPWRSSHENPIGGFYRFSPDGTLEQIDTGLAFPNGVAIDAEEAYVYLAETGERRILRYALRADGSIGEREIWAATGTQSGPDGMALAANGDVLVAQYGSARIDVLDQAGNAREPIPVPGPNPTNCAFGGSDRDRLVVTEVATGSIYAYHLDFSGQPLHDR